MGARRESGFTLIETAVVVALVALVTAAAGTLFLGGASPAVASAARDVAAALDETRRSATAFDVASLVFAPLAGRSGYSARVYAGKPGDALFRARNGPDYRSAVTIAETDAPLGAPGFALTIDRRGEVSAFANFTPGAGNTVRLPCPASGRFVLHLQDQHAVRDVPVACAFAPGAAVPIAFAAAPAAAPPLPSPAGGCPSGFTCAVVPLPPGGPAGACPAGSVADAALPGVCDAVPDPPVATAAPVATPTPCPQAFSGTAPACSGQIVEQYGANADPSGAHTTTFFANGGICDDHGCSLTGPVDWTWGCAFAARAGAAGTLAGNAPALRNPVYTESVYEMIALATHDAAQDSGSGIVYENDSYCTGIPVPAR